MGNLLTFSNQAMHPFLSVLITHVIISIIALLPASSPGRRWGVLAIWISCAISLGSIDYQQWWSQEFALYVCGVGLYSSYLINMRKLAASPHKSRVQKLTWAWGRCFDPRSGIAMADLPPFRVGDSEYVPSTATFLMQRIWTLAWTVGGYVFCCRHPMDLYLSDFQSPKNHIIRRLADMSAREWRVLLHTAFTGWFVPYCLLTAVHSFSSVVAVACGDAPGDWRPLFGDLREAYTVQRFFG